MEKAELMFKGHPDGFEFPSGVFGETPSLLSLKWEEVLEWSYHEGWAGPFFVIWVRRAGVTERYFAHSRNVANFEEMRDYFRLSYSNHNHPTPTIPTDAELRSYLRRVYFN